MAWPETVQTVTLTVGPLYDAGGNLRRGVPLTARLSRLVLFDDGGGALPTTVTASTDETGIATLELVATDSTGIDSTGWTYRLTCPGVLAAGGIDVALPAAAPTVAVETLAAQTAADGSTVWTPGAVYSVNGATGAVTLDLATAVSDYLTANPVSLAVDDLTDVDATGIGAGEAIVHNGTSYVASSAAVILEGDSRLTDARTPSSHTHPASEISDSTATGQAVVTAVDAAAARTAIGAGTSSFDGAYSSLSGTPTLGGAAALNVGTAPGTVAAGDHNHTGVYAPALGADDNYVTDAEKVVIGNTSGTNTGDQDLSGYATIAQPRNTQTGTTYTLVASDAGKIVTLDNASAITVTVPASTITVPSDTVVRVDFLTLGAGMPTFVGSGGMTVNADPSLVADAQYAGLSLLLLSATSSVLVGRLATP